MADAPSTTALDRRGWVPGVLPGFKPTLGITLTYLGLIVLIPLAGLVLKTSELRWSEFWRAISGPRALAAYRLSFGGALLAALLDVACGLVVTWVLVRYRFFGKRFADALVDLPLALPTSVAGIALTAIYSKNGWVGSRLEPFGIRVAFAPAGVIVAMIFVGIPFVVRTIQPVLVDVNLDLDPQLLAEGDKLALEPVDSSHEGHARAAGHGTTRRAKDGRSRDKESETMPTRRPPLHKLCLLQRTSSSEMTGLEHGGALRRATGGNSCEKAADPPFAVDRNAGQHNDACVYAPNHRRVSADDPL